MKIGIPLPPASCFVAGISIDPLLQLLRRKARHTHAELAEALALSETEVRQRLAEWEKNGTILGYQTVNPFFPAPGPAQRLFQEPPARLLTAE